MLSKITKLVCAGVIIWLNGLCVWGNRIDVFYEGGPTLVAEGIDGVELPTELSDPSHDLWDEYDPYVKFVGIRLNLPQELIADCEDKYWKIHDDALIQELEEIVSTEENFHNWCNKQKIIYHSDYFLRRKYAYILKKVNANNYFISSDFCKQIELDRTLYSICRKNYICFHFLYHNSPQEQYLSYLKWEIKDYFCDNPQINNDVHTDFFTNSILNLIETLQNLEEK